MRIVNNLWNYRHLTLKLAVSEFKLRYKNSILGFFWSLLEPLLMLLVLYMVFTNLMKVNIEHYQLFLLLGIITWGFLEKGTNMSLNSIVGRPSLVKKVYFPREVLIISSCLTALFMTSLEFLVFIFFMVFFKVIPGYIALISPLIFAVEFLLIAGISLCLGTLNVYYRDIQYIWRVVLQVGFFATPILYPISIFPEKYVPLVLLNPMARIITIMRDSIIYKATPSGIAIAYIVITAILVLGLGYYIFSKLEPGFAEEV